MSTACGPHTPRPQVPSLKFGSLCAPDLECLGGGVDGCRLLLVAGHTVKAESGFWFLRECWGMQPWRTGPFPQICRAPLVPKLCLKSWASWAAELPACPPGGLCVYVNTDHLIYLPIKIESHYMALAALELAS